MTPGGEAILRTLFEVVRQGRSRELRMLVPMILRVFQEECLELPDPAEDFGLPLPKSGKQRQAEYMARVRAREAPTHHSGAPPPRSSSSLPSAASSTEVTKSDASDVSDVSDEQGGRGILSLSSPTDPDLQDQRERVARDVSDVSDGDSVTRVTVRPVAKRNGRNGHAVLPGLSDDEQRVVRRTDALPAELREAAKMLGVRDIDTAWLKFTGHNDGQVIPVSGWWQKWCADEKKREESRAFGGGREQANRPGLQPTGPEGRRAWRPGEGT